MPRIDIRSVDLTIHTGSLFQRAADVHVLKDVSAVIRPGLTALMGASGSGKTTLLNLVAGHMGKTRHSMTGAVLCDGVPVSESETMRSAAYMTQGDHLLPHFTVRECLTFAADMSLPVWLSADAKAKKIAALIEELGLSECADTLIGDDMIVGCSGGEKRRVSIGVQLLTDPSVLFLDEPTTGLDSFTSLAIVRLLHTLTRARRGLAVVVSLHQPRADIFALFDEVVLLAQGRVAFAGPRGLMPDYFSSLGLPCPRSSNPARGEGALSLPVNPADHFIDVTALDTRSQAAEKATRGRLEMLLRHWQETGARTVAAGRRVLAAADKPRLTSVLRKTPSLSSISYNAGVGADAGVGAGEDTPVSGLGEHGSSALPLNNNNGSGGNFETTSSQAGIGGDGTPRKKGVRWAQSIESVQHLPPAPAHSVLGDAEGRPGFLYQTATLTGRFYKQARRDRLTILGGLLQSFLMTIIVGLVFLQLSGSLADLRSRTSLLYLTCTLAPYITLMSQLYTQTRELAVFDHDRKAGQYSAAAYLTARWLCFGPVLIATSAVCSTILYYMTGLSQAPWEVPARFILFTTLPYLFVLSLATLCSAISRSFALSSLIANALFTFKCLGCGFFIQSDSIPPALRWVRKGSYIYYTFSALASNEFSGRLYDCPLKDTDPDSPLCDLYRGNYVLAQLGIPVDEWWLPILITLGMTVGVYLAAVAVLSFWVPGESLSTGKAGESMLGDAEERAGKRVTERDFFLVPVGVDAAWAEAQQHGSGKSSRSSSMTSNASSLSFNVNAAAAAAGAFAASSEARKDGRSLTGDGCALTAADDNAAGSVKTRKSNTVAGPPSADLALSTTPKTSPSQSAATPADDDSAPAAADPSSASFTVDVASPELIAALRRAGMRPAPADVLLPALDAAEALALAARPSASERADEGAAAAQGAAGPQRRVPVTVVLDGLSVSVPIKAAAAPAQQPASAGGDASETEEDDDYADVNPAAGAVVAAAGGDGLNGGGAAPSPVVTTVSSLQPSPSFLGGADGARPERTLVRPVHAVFRPGQVTAILGGSGSGKSTLLHAVAQRLAGGSYSVRGGLYFNARPATDEAARACMGLVAQHDALLPSLTVQETLQYAAKLRLPASLSAEERDARVRQVLLELGLRDCATSIIGSETVKGISGGEKRRVSIGVQLLTDPSVVLLDEPTSGLDSYTAFQVMRTVKRVARKGRTIVVTVHQPRADVFSLFDNILVLSKSHLVFAGPPSALQPYFATMPARLVPPRARDTNPADWLLDALSVDTRSEARRRDSRRRVRELEVVFAQRHMALCAHETETSVAIDMLRATSSAVAEAPTAEPVSAQDEILGSLRTPTGDDCAEIVVCLRCAIMMSGAALAVPCPATPVAIHAEASMPGSPAAGELSPMAVAVPPPLADPAVLAERAAQYGVGPAACEALIAAGQHVFVRRRVPLTLVQERAAAIDAALGAVIARAAANDVVVPSLAALRDCSSLADALLPAGDDDAALGEARQRAGFCRAFPVLMQRSWLNLVRQPDLLTARLSQIIAFGAIFSIFFLQLGHGQVGAANRVGMITMALSIVSVGMLNAVAMFPPDRNVFYVETADGVYSTAPFFVSYLSTELVSEVLGVCAYTAFSVFMVDMNVAGDPAGMALTAYVTFCLVFFGETLGMLFCAFFYHVGFAVSLVTTFISFLNCQAGFLAVDSTIWLPLRYLNFASPLRYAARVLAILEFDGAVFTCTPAEMIDGACPTATGAQVLKMYEIDAADLSLFLGILAALSVVYRALAMAALHLHRPQAKAGHA